MESKHGILRTGVVGRAPRVAGDDVASHPPARAMLTAEFADASWKDALLFRLNGEELTGGRFASSHDDQAGCRVEYRVSVPLLKTGRNFIAVAARNGVKLPDSIVTISAMRLKIGYT